MDLLGKCTPPSTHAGASFGSEANCSMGRAAAWRAPPSPRLLLLEYRAHCKSIDIERSPNLSRWACFATVM